MKPSAYISDSLAATPLGSAIRTGLSRVAIPSDGGAGNANIAFVHGLSSPESRAVRGAWGGRWTGRRIRERRRGASGLG
jgi:hypothetical protein